MMLMMCATATFGASWLLRAVAGASAAPSLPALGLGVAGAALLGAGGWLGGALVYRHGIGRASE